MTRLTKNKIQKSELIDREKRGLERSKLIAKTNHPCLTACSFYTAAGVNYISLKNGFCSYCCAMDRRSNRCNTEPTKNLAESLDRVQREREKAMEQLTELSIRIVRLQKQERMLKDRANRRLKELSTDSEKSSSNTVDTSLEKKGTEKGKNKRSKGKGKNFLSNISTSVINSLIKENYT